MKKLLLLLIVLLMTSCASFQVSTLNHDPIYNSNVYTPTQIQWNPYQNYQFITNQSYNWYYPYNSYNRFSWFNPYGMGFTYSWNHHRWSSNGWNHPNWYLGSNLYYNQYNQINRRRITRRVTQYQIPSTTRRRTNTRTQRTNNTISPIRISNPSRRVTPQRNTVRRNTNVQIPRRRVSRTSPTTTRRTTPIIVKKSRNQ